MGETTIGRVSRLTNHFNLINSQNTFIGIYNGVNTNNIVQIDLDMLQHKDKEKGGIIKIPGDTLGKWYKRGYQKDNIIIKDDENTFVLSNQIDNIQKIVLRTDCTVESYEKYLKF